MNEDQIGLAGYRDDYALPKQKQLKKKFGSSFQFQRFQDPQAIKEAFSLVRSTKSFKWFKDKDRKGLYCVTPLEGNFLLVESRQLCVDCTTDDVLRVYLSGDLQAKWNARNLLECYFTKLKKNDKDEEQNSEIRLRENRQDDQRQPQHESSKYSSKYYYRQDLLLK